MSKENPGMNEIRCDFDGTILFAFTPDSTGKFRCKCPHCKMIYPIELPLKTE